MSAKLYHPLAPLLATAFLAGLWQLRRDLRLALVMLSLCFVGTTLLLLVSLYKPIFGVRMLLWASSPVYALIGVGVASVPRIAAPLALVFSATVAWLVWPSPKQQYARLDKELWRELVKTIETCAIPGAVAVAAHSEEAMMIQYYRQRRTQPIGSFRFIATRHKLPREVRHAPQVLLFDRKRGARSARSQRELEGLGYTTNVREFPPLKLLELIRGP